LSRITSNAHRSDSKNQYSIIVCSIDDNKFQKLVISIKNTFSKAVQVIRIADARSLAEGYNRGIHYANGKIIIFCHDDIEFLNSNVDEIIEKDLKKFDIVGVAGTCRLIQGAWISAGQPFVHGQVAHKDSEHGDGITLCLYGLGRDNTIVNGVQALDGLFIAMNRYVLDDLRFDETLFTGFHLYDLDYTYAAYLKGYRIAIDHRIHLIHDSIGRFGTDWKNYAELFYKKYETVLPKNENDAFRLIRGVHFYSKNRTEHEMQVNSAGKRLWMEKGSEKLGSYLKIYIKIADNTYAILARNNCRLPFRDSSINYLCCRYHELSGKEKIENFAEILRICRHGAIIEFVMHFKKNNAEKETTQNQFFGPQTVYSENSKKIIGVLVPQGSERNGTGINSTCYQIKKQ
jgi:glycosyltransferase involved in cell wall biosynthesis